MNGFCMLPPTTHNCQSGALGLRGITSAMGLKGGSKKAGWKTNSIDLDVDKVRGDVICVCRICMPPFAVPLYDEEGDAHDWCDGFA